MAGRRRLIVNADDFGHTTAVNAGIIAAHERGIVTSASLMVRGSAAREAARYARARPRFSLGLHLDLGEWAYVDGTWHLRYEVVPLDDGDAVRDEMSRQLERFRELVARDPTHVDSHQHVHTREPACAAAHGLACRLDVPLRGFANGIRYRGEFYGQREDGTPLPEAVAVPTLARLLRRLEPGTTELGCHPGEADTAGSIYAAERAQEVDALCHRAIAQAIDREGIELLSFAEVARSR